MTVQADLSAGRLVQAKWANPPIAWYAAKAQFAIYSEARFAIQESHDLRLDLVYV